MNPRRWWTAAPLVTWIAVSAVVFAGCGTTADDHPSDDRPAALDKAPTPADRLPPEVAGQTHMTAASARTLPARGAIRYWVGTRGKALCFLAFSPAQPEDWSEACSASGPITMGNPLGTFEFLADGSAKRGKLAADWTVENTYVRYAPAG